MSHASREREKGKGSTTLSELALLFLRLGCTAFGGPAAHLAMMRDEVVRRRSWLTDQEFLDLHAATQLIPGPNSTELAIHIGWVRRRWLGLFTAGVSFIVPAMLLTMGLGWMYQRYGSLPSAHALIYGIKPVIVAIIVQALWGLWPVAARNTRLRVLGLLAFVASELGGSEVAVLFATGGLAACFAQPKSRDQSLLQLAPPVPLMLAASAPHLVSVSSLFWVFLKIGSVLFGSGYVLVAFLRAELVEKLGWLSDSQLIEAVAVGQITPGPVFTTATFVGYVLAGPSGALTATLGIFLPAFVFVAVSVPLVPRLRSSPIASAFLDGLNVASLVLMGVATAQIATSALVDLPTIAIGLLSAFALLRFKLNASWLVIGGALLGVGAHAAGIAWR